MAISIDGLAPRSFTCDSMPMLTAIAREGASCYAARTITPSVTLPAHASMLRGVGADRHGVNEPRTIDHPAPSFLRVGRRAGRRVAAVDGWSPSPPVPGVGCCGVLRRVPTVRDLLAAPDAVVELVLRPGDLVAFDNCRVLHGRTEFRSRARRHVQGCYIDMDAVRSTARRAEWARLASPE